LNRRGDGRILKKRAIRIKGEPPGSYKVRSTRGQTMTEYAFILAAIAVVVYGVYKALGNNIGSLANGVDSTLTNA
jgi:Flp pilus assembly pilin Flp